MDYLHLAFIKCFVCSIFLGLNIDFSGCWFQYPYTFLSDLVGFLWSNQDEQSQLLQPRVHYYQAIKAEGSERGPPAVHQTLHLVSEQSMWPAGVLPTWEPAPWWWEALYLPEIPAGIHSWDWHLISRPRTKDWCHHHRWFSFGPHTSTKRSRLLRTMQHWMFYPQYMLMPQSTRLHTLCLMCTIQQV